MKEIKLKDYKSPDYIIPQVELYVDIRDKDVFVESTLYIERKRNNDLILNGQDLTLEELKIDNELYSDYSYDDDLLTIKNLPDSFKLFTRVKIDPYNNKSMEGFYKSGNILCSQNEAEGFRRITFFSDRPDVMSKYKITLEADAELYPNLLANGNLIESQNKENGRIIRVWEDPFVKPCYLVAIVAGDLELVKDKFTTRSGREIALEIYTDKGKGYQCSHAMESLKNSMRWDEERFGLEYDLDLYMIVAVDSFNAGAMENKGLNIFNSVYVLADPETATDSDFDGVEGVIGHEYFHNWTGNRVTCRDWFQLTLKEGLTVFRDQEFSSDMTDRTVKRIEDVSVLRNHQFPEDKGPNSHPIKPETYIEIDNFYTATVYEKGAEVIRMVHTLIGEKNFRAGMDLYFERHDGSAVTTEDFISAMSDASGVDLEQFKLWYSQAGTPVLDIESEYNSGVYKLKIEQTIPETAYNCSRDPQFFPLNIGLFNSKGEDVTPADMRQLIISKKEEVFEFETGENVIPSINQGFSAPVEINYNYTIDELIKLINCDSDNFNRFDAVRRVAISACEEILNGKSVNSEIIEAYRKLLQDRDLDKRLLSTMIYIPEIKEIVERMPIYDYQAADKARTDFAVTVSENLKGELFRLFEENISDKFSNSKEAVASRTIKNRALSLLSFLGDDIAQIAFKQFNSADNMSDYITAFAALQRCNDTVRKEANNAFYEKWKENFLVMNKWLRVQASRNSSDLLKDVTELMGCDIFDNSNPNRVRALYGAFAGNSVQFHREDGAGYKFLTDRIIEIDKFNPHLSAGLAGAFRTYSYLKNSQKDLLKAQLDRIIDTKDISPGLYEIISKTISAGA